eukprot:Skav234463  [mRNA]  locus=scaffold1647:194440:195981:+ [translate_table: standard]
MATSSSLRGLRSLLIVAAFIAAIFPGTWRDVFSLPRDLSRRAKAAGGPVVEAEVEVKPEEMTKASKDLKPNALNSTEEDIEQKKRERVVAKTAETKKRVEEKKKRLQSERANSDTQNAKSSEEQSEEQLVDWKGLASQARKMAEEAQKEAAAAAAKGTEDKQLEVFKAEAKESFFQLSAVGLEAASQVPPVILAVSSFVTLALVIVLSSSKPATVEPPRKVTSAPTIVSVQTPAPVPAVPAPVVVPEIQKPKASNPAPATSAPSPFGQGLANSAANTLRSIADVLPGAEKAVEDELPVVQSAIQWASGVNADNAPQKVENDLLPAVGKAAEGALRLGLQVGAGGLDFLGQNLPAAEKALGKVVDTGLPLAQSALREAASSARQVASEGISIGDSSNPYLQGAASAVPGVLNATASVLDATADSAPAVKSAVGYVADAATPVAQAALSAASDLAKDLSEVPEGTVQGGVSKVIEAAKTAPDVANSAKQALSAALSGAQSAQTEVAAAQTQVAAE